MLGDPTREEPHLCGINHVDQPTAMGHEYAGIVEEIGDAVTSVRVGDFVIGSFFASDNTCPSYQAGDQSSCVHREFVGGAQAGRIRVPLALGTAAPPTCSSSHNKTDAKSRREEAS